MLIHTRINLVLAAMISLCLGSVIAAQTPSLASYSASSVLSMPISQRAEALAFDLLLKRASDADRGCAVSRSLGSGPHSEMQTSPGLSREFEMPFFSFGGRATE